MNAMPNILDLAILALLGFFLVKGLMQGLIREVMGLVGIVAGLFLGLAYYGQLAQLARQALRIEAPWLDAVSFGVILLVVFALVVSLGALITSALAKMRLSPLNRLLGGALGLLKGVLLAYLLLNMLLLLMPFSPPQQLRSSLAAPYVISIGREVMSLAPDDFIHTLQERSGLTQPGAAEATPTPSPDSPVNKETQP